MSGSESGRSCSGKMNAFYQESTLYSMQYAASAVAKVWNVNAASQLKFPDKIVFSSCSNLIWFSYFIHLSSHSAFTLKTWCYLKFRLNLGCFEVPDMQAERPKDRGPSLIKGLRKEEQRRRWKKNHGLSSSPQSAAWRGGLNSRKAENNRAL